MTTFPEASSRGMPIRPSLEERLYRTTVAARDVAGILIQSGIMPTCEFVDYRRPGLLPGSSKAVLSGWTIGVQEPQRPFSGSRYPISIDLLGNDGVAYVDGRPAQGAATLPGWDPNNPDAFDLSQRLKIVLSTNRTGLVRSGRRPDALVASPNSFGLDERLLRVTKGLIGLTALHGIRDTWRLRENR